MKPSPEVRKYLEELLASPEETRVAAAILEHGREDERIKSAVFGDVGALMLTCGIIAKELIDVLDPTELEVYADDPLALTTHLMTRIVWHNLTLAGLVNSPGDVAHVKAILELSVDQLAGNLSVQVPEDKNIH